MGNSHVSIQVIKQQSADNKKTVKRGRRINKTNIFTTNQKF